MGKKGLFLIVTVLLATSVFGQKIQNVKAEATGDQIIITYDLIGASEGQEFRIQLYSSNNNYTIPLIKVTGDVGNRIPAGLQRRVTWASREELKDFKGAVTLEVRGEPLAATPVVVGAATAVAAVSPYTINSPSGGGVKKKKNLTISWIGGSKEERVQIQLLQNDSFHSNITEMLNSGNYTWSVPNMKGTYQIKIKGANGEATSNPFKIKSGSKALLIVGGAAVVGGVIYFITSGGKDKELPAPPEPN